MREDGIRADPNIQPCDVRGGYGDKIRKELERSDQFLNGEPLPDYEAILKLSEKDRLELLVFEIGLPVRTANILESARISNVRDLLEHGKSDILEIANIGKATVEEISSILTKIQMGHLFC